jgi:hypothetical protein
VRVPVQDKINVTRQMVRRYMLETEFQSASRKIDNERPIKVTIAIASHHGYARPNSAEVVENGLRANITQVPDFVSIFGDFSNRFWQTIVGVRQNENMQGILRFFRRWHSAKLSLQTVTYPALRPHVSMHALICATADVT